MLQILADDVSSSVCKISSMRLVIRGINERCALAFEPVTKRQRRMIEIVGPDRDVSYFKGTLNKLMVSNPSPEVIQLNGKIGILHLAFQSVAQGSVHPLRRIKIPLITRREERREKWDPLDVVPMSVTDQYVPSERGSLSSNQVLAEQTNASTAVDDDERVAGRSDLQT